MKDPQKIDKFLEEFGRIWKEQCPNWNFGQIVSNLIREYGDLTNTNEEVMLVKIKDYFKTF